jgi:beta-glucosidase
MNMKKIFKRTSLLLATALIGGTATVQAQKSPQDMDRFIDALMRRMTVEEKIGQLNLPVTGEITTGQAKSSDVAKKIEQGLVGGLFNLKGVAKIRDVQKLAVENSRLGIPLLFGMDVIHGYETIFPIPLGLSCTWDMAAIEQSARIAATEASADGISWTFSPMVDISRDPRWGRVSEGSGEDPFLGGAIARAMVLGYQGKDLNDQLTRNDEIMACVKHFALYGAGEAGRDYNTVDMSRNRMFNEYMYPYEAAVRAGVGSVMASFNEVDGVPATANHWLMTNVLRKQWGFNGFVVPLSCRRRRCSSSVSTSTKGESKAGLSRARSKWENAGIGKHLQSKKKLSVIFQKKLLYSNNLQCSKENFILKSTDGVSTQSSHSGSAGPPSSSCARLLLCTRQARQLQRAAQGIDHPHR